MAQKLCIKLQAPTIELKVQAKDVSGAKDSMLVGFKRYEIKESQERIEKLQELLKATEGTVSNDPSMIALDNYVKSEIVYLKNVNLDLVDEATGKSNALSIQDTRSAKPNDSLWGSADECLVVLLDLYLSSAPWRLSLILAAQKALFNADYSEEAAKN